MVNSMELDFQYETPRLLLQILQEPDAPMVLNFHTKNAAIFEKYEADRPELFYTLKYQRAVLAAELSMVKSKNCLRFWVFERSNPDKIIGTVSFHYVINSPFHSCQIGYKFDPDYWRMGYATETLEMAIDVASGYLNLHRIEAYVHPDNTASIRLLEKLHFERECLARHSILLKGRWEDHYRYALILES